MQMLHIIIIIIIIIIINFTYSYMYLLYHELINEQFIPLTADTRGVMAQLVKA